MKLLYVALGGAVGSVLRYLLAKLTGEVLGHGFPWGTLLVNILGCFCIGFLASLVGRNALSNEMRCLLIAGFCGGFTTFSTFAFESFTLWNGAAFFKLVAYLFLSVFLGLMAVWGGARLSLLVSQS